ncbi:MAG: carbohydrate ABC transporter permease [Clostridiales bacterium]|nr:carbohydrate ABC transporter permease [Clostridiales bacterium]
MTVKTVPNVKPAVNNTIKISVGDKAYYTVVYSILGLFTLLIILPLINVVANSFSSQDAVAFGWVTFWPVDFTLKGYRAVFAYKGIWTAYANTFVYAIVGTTINLSMTMICAYPLARKSLPGHGIITGLFMFTMFFGGGTIPNYILVRSLGMINTRSSMIIPGALSVYNMIIARTFINNIPTELEEAAKIDGCSDFKYFFNMVLPLSGTVMAVLALYYAVGHWNDYFTAFLYLKDQDKMPLQMVLRAILIKNSFNTESLNSSAQELLYNQSLQDLLKYCFIVVSTLPILVLYPFVKKYFVKGVMIGAVKG